MQALAFDLGGTHLRSAIVRGGAVDHLKTRRLQGSDEVCGRSDIWDVILGHMVLDERASAKFLGASDPIVISFPGPVAKGRQIVQAPTVSGAQAPMFDLAGELEERTGRTVHMLNDISAAAWQLAGATDLDRFLVVTISSGIGSKIFDRRHADGVLDEPVYAGEIGHMVVDDDPAALMCDCGGRGHLGAIASGRGIERTARLRARTAPTAFVGSCVHACLGGSAETLCNERHIVPAALRGDAWALAVVRECTRPLARVLLANVMGAGLQGIFVIGGFARALGCVYVQILIDLMVEMSEYAVVRDVVPGMVRAGFYCEEPCLVGCGAFLDFVGRRA